MPRCGSSATQPISSWVGVSSLIFRQFRSLGDGDGKIHSAVTLHIRRVTDTLSCFQEASVKKIVLALAVVVAAAGVANAQTAATKPAAQTKSAAKSAEHKTEKAAPMKAEVVSTDAAAKTITVKDASG